MRSIQSAWLFVGLFCAATVVTECPGADTGTPTIVGTWEWALELGSAGGKVSMVVESIDGKLKATVTAPDGNVLQAKDFAAQQDRVSFSISRDMGLMKMVMSHTGKLVGDEINGTFDMKGGPMKKSGKWYAKRVKSK